MTTGLTPSQSDRHHVVRSDPSLLDDMTSEISSYTHEPLEYSDSVRLLQLYPGQSGAPLYGRLIQVRQSEIPAYEALSYVWGDYDISYDLVLERCNTTCEQVSRLQISHNLSAALGSLRKERTIRVLWVDAICIDQSNPEEKGHQVAHMGQIYRSATQVIAWMGGVENEQELEELHQLAWWGEHLLRAPNYDPWPIYNLFCRSRFTFAFFHRPWWKRLWIVQEFLLAVDVEFRVGPLSIPLETIYQVNGLANEMILMGHAAKADIVRQFLRDFVVAKTLLDHRKDYKEYPPSLATMVLSFSRDRLCGDNRDRVYALLGLTNNPIPLLPDYTIPEAQVYYNFAISCLLSGDLTILSECSDAKSMELSDHLSFVPILQQAINQPARIRRHVCAGDTVELPSKGRPFHSGGLVDVNVSVCDNDGIKIHGVVIDEAVGRSELSENSEFGVYDSEEEISDSVGFAHWKQQIIPAFEQHLQWLKDQDHHVSSSAPVATTLQACDFIAPYYDESLFVVFLRTISADVRLDGNDDDLFNLNDWDHQDDSDHNIEKSGIASASMYFMRHRLLFITSKDYLGLGPQHMKPNDTVVIFDGDEKTLRSSTAWHRMEDRWPVLPSRLDGRRLF